MRSTTFLRPVAVGLVGVAVLAACGGSDDDSGGDPTDVQSDDASSSDGVDVSGSGSNDEAQESLDEAGVDLDLDELEDSLTAGGFGDGEGVVTIDGAAYVFSAEVCIAQGPTFTASGLSAGPDGTPAWVEISYSNDFDFDDDGEFDETLDVTVEVGKTELFGSGSDDQPDWSASKIDAATLQSGEDLTVSLDGNSISGGGPIGDFNAVAIAFGETVPMTFQATCG